MKKRHTFEAKAVGIWRGKANGIHSERVSAQISCPANSQADACKAAIEMLKDLHTEHWWISCDEVRIIVKLQKKKR